MPHPPQNMDKFLQQRILEIRNVFPSDISSVDTHDGGDDFFVIEINREWMFRFARTGISRKALEVEKAFLARFKPTSPLPVPDHKYGGDDFVGYPKIHGRQLDIDLFHSLSKTNRKRIAQQIGQFLSAVHTFPIDEAKRLGVTEGWDGWHAKIIENFRQVVAPALSPSARKRGLEIVERMQAVSFEYKVIHGDFALEDHIFFDENRGELSGVIDFADVTLNDPAHDFQNIVEYGGGEFFEAVMRDYQDRDDSSLLQRTRHRIEARPLLEASSSLLFGFEKRCKERMKYIEGKYG